MWVFTLQEKEFENIQNHLSHVFNHLWPPGWQTQRVHCCAQLSLTVCVFCEDFFFLMWTIFKVLIEFVTILLLFYVLISWPRGVWDLSSPTRDWTCTPCLGRWSLNQWTTRESPCHSRFTTDSEHLALWTLELVKTNPGHRGNRGLCKERGHPSILHVCACVCVHRLPPSWFTRKQGPS